VTDGGNGGAGGRGEIWVIQYDSDPTGVGLLAYPTINV
jgi:hypothetical protein